MVIPNEALFINLNSHFGSRAFWFKGWIPIVAVFNNGAAQAQ